MTIAAARARQVIENARASNEAWLKSMSGLTFLRGHARLSGPATVVVEGETLHAPKIFLNVGGRAHIPSMPGITDVPYLDNTGLVALDHVPEHLAIVGGGSVGLEFAPMDRRLAPRATLIHRARGLDATRNDASSPTLATKTRE